MKPKIVVKREACTHQMGWNIKIPILWLFCKKIFVCQKCGMTFDAKRLKKA